MRIVDKYIDYLDDYKTRIFETKEGLRVVETIKQGTKKCDISISPKAGSVYEEIIGVPYDTAGEQFFNKYKPSIWIVSPYENDEIEIIAKSSSLYQRYLK
jgi:hypothetical protein